MTNEPFPYLQVTAFSQAQRFIGIKEIRGSLDNPFIMSMLKLDNKWPEHDEVPWCSAFANYVCWLLYLPRSKDLRARSWLGVGRTVSPSEAQAAYDVVILSRGPNAPGPEVLDAPGHVGFYAGHERDQDGVWRVAILGGNQGDSVSTKLYPTDRILGIRRICE